MLSPLRNRFGIPGVISVIALVFAMFGGAYAATNDSGNATSSAKAKKGPRGPKGPKGPKGDTGPAGPAGPAGSAGAKGDKGDAGSSGSNGQSAAATSFTGAKGPIGGVTCTEGGLEVKSASGTTLVCNGKKGTNGKDGETGFTETLPPGETETGVWTIGPIGGGAVAFGKTRVPISFNIPLSAADASAMNESRVHVINDLGEEVKGITATEVAPQTTCTGSSIAPTAPPGHLCIYTTVLNGAKLSTFWVKKTDQSETTGAGSAGALLGFIDVEEEGNGNGSWAVTAEEA